MADKTVPKHTFWDDVAGEDCANCGASRAAHDSMPEAPGVDAETAREAGASFVVAGKLYFVVPTMVGSEWRYEVVRANGRVIAPKYPIDTDAGLSDLDAFVDRVHAYGGRN